MIVSKAYTVPAMCSGCANDRRTKCRVINEPGWVYENRHGKCWAYMTKERSKQIESEIRNNDSTGQNEYKREWDREKLRQKREGATA